MGTAAPLLCLLPLLVAPLGAQDDGDALAARADAASLAALRARAAALQEHKQYGRATQLWREIVQDWAPLDAQALTALGFVQVAGQWHRDANKLVLERDVAADAGVKRLDAEWARAQRELARAHERAAQALAAAGQQERALAQWRRVLRFLPGDRRAQAAVQQTGFDGFFAPAADLQLLRKGRAIAQAVAYLRAYKPRTEPIQGRTQPLLAKVGLAHQGVASDHFEVWGTLPPERLALAAQYAERALLLCRMLFGTADGAVFRPARVLPFVWVGDRATYRRVLEACADQFESPERLRFLENDVELAFVRSGEDLLRLYVLASGSDDELLDQSVRGVAQDATLFKSHGLWEGIGHAVCGLLFGRTLSFFVEQQTARTVTDWKPRPLVPDIATWAEIAAEAAWARNDTPTAQLVLLHGSKFSNEERVKAWAMSDYLLRRSPELLLQLDACKERQVGPRRFEEVKDPGTVEAEFQRRAHLPLSGLDDEWRGYWGRGQALRAAMAGKPGGSAADVAAAQALVQAIDDARCAADVGPAGFYVSASPAVEAAQAWAGALDRAEQEQRQNKGKQVALPAPPEAVGSAVLVAREADPRAAVARWLLQPVRRGELLHPGRILFGASKSRNALVLDLAEPAAPVARGLPVPWPRHGQSGVPGGCKAADLGPGFAAALLAAGRGPDADVGVPVSLHFFRKLPDAERAQVQGRVRVGWRAVDSVLVCAQGDGPPAEHADGCFVCVPLDPLPPGGPATAEWTLPRSLRGDGADQPLSATFTVR